MSKTTKNSAAHFSPEAGFLLSSLSSAETGITGTVVWFSAGEFADPDPQLGPRLLVVLGDDLKAGWGEAVSVLLSDPPEVLGTLPPEVRRQVLAFVDKNRKALLGHWNGELSTRETLDLLERASK